MNERETNKTYSVVCSFGHCGAHPNKYVLFSGTMHECANYMKTLPPAEGSDICHCGGYTGTAPLVEQCYIEYDNDESKNW